MTAVVFALVIYSVVVIATGFVAIVTGPREVTVTPGTAFFTIMIHGVYIIVLLSIL